MREFPMELMSFFVWAKIFIEIVGNLKLLKEKM